MNSNFPEILTNRLLLRKFRDSDIQNVFHGLSHPKVIKFYGISFKTLEETKIQMDWFENLVKEKTGIWWAVCSKDNKTFYGAGGLNDIDSKFTKAEIGFWLLPNFWGNGIMKEAMPLILDYGFNTIKLKRIEGMVESMNINCKNALEKIDFNFEKTIKDYEVKNGESIDVDIYSNEII